jgi:hypothetical protein
MWEKTLRKHLELDFKIGSPDGPFLCLDGLVSRALLLSCPNGLQKG